MRHSGPRRAGLGLGIGVAAAALAWALGLLPFLQTVELKTYDLRVRMLTDASQASRDIVIVSIDDASIRKLEPLVGRWPWPRLVHATLVDYLSRARASAIVYDVLFTERDRRSFTVQGEPWTGEESDRALSDAVARAGNVIVVGDVTTSDPLDAARQATQIQAIGRSRVPVSPAFEVRSSLIPPFDDLATAAAAIGHNLLVLDPDGPVRRSVPAVRIGDGAVPSLALATALRTRQLPPTAVRVEGDFLTAGDARIPLVAASVTGPDGRTSAVSRILVRFTGPVVDERGAPTYPEYSFYDLFYSETQLQSGAAPFVSPEVFKNKIVFVGTTAAGLHDVFTVPFAAGKMPGAQIHANVVDNIVSGRFMEPAPLWASAAVATAGAALVGLLVLVVNLSWAVAGALAVTAAIAGFASWLFLSGIWVEVARPMVAVAFSLFAGTAYQYFVEGREKRLVKQVFSRFVSRDVYDQLMADPTRARLGGHRRDMTVLFSDIRGFTTFTEQGRAEAVVSQLNDYFSTMVPIVFAQRGTVDKFVGDMIMALFGAPLEDEDHADHAVAAALAMLEALDGLNARWAAAGLPVLDIGIGINTGDMVAGNIGSESIMSYTVIGDAVNLGSRLESLNKQYGTRIIISAFTRSRLKGRYDMKPLGTVTVKGKSEPVDIFEIRPEVPARP